MNVVILFVIIILSTIAGRCLSEGEPGYTIALLGCSWLIYLEVT